MSNLQCGHQLFPKSLRSLRAYLRGLFFCACRCVSSTNPTVENPISAYESRCMEALSALKRRLPSRRKFLHRVAQVTLGLSVGTVSTCAYGYWEASQIRVRRSTIPMKHLPRVFAGKTVAVLADFHHGPFVDISFIRTAVEIANSLAPDLMALVGDFAHKGNQTREQLPPCLEALSALRAPLGVFAVPGNHDMQDNGAIYRECIAATPLQDVTNRAVRLSIGGEHLWVAGVDDLWWGKPDQRAALRGIPDLEAVILLSHNPDFAEEQPNDRVGLVISGHTHGGQVCVPVVGSLWLPSRYGSKYRSGLVQGPSSQVFVSRGIVLAGVPLRINCFPEINLLTLT